MTEPDDVRSSRGEVILYATADGRTRVECRFAEESLWLSQAAMMDLYQSTRANISIHLKGVFEDGELDEEAVVKSYLTTAADGKNYQVRHYRLEAVLAVGYRVRSARGTQFRQWATARLSEYLVKGFTLDDWPRRRLVGGACRLSLGAWLVRGATCLRERTDHFLPGTTRDLRSPPASLPGRFIPRSANDRVRFRVRTDGWGFLASSPAYRIRHPRVPRGKSLHQPQDLRSNRWAATVRGNADVWRG